MIDDKIKVKPFVKWAGGKSQLISTIESFLPSTINKSEPIIDYVEPFIGGGALFFYLLSEYGVEKAYVSDINKDLILSYKIIRDHPEELIEILKPLENEFRKNSHEKRKKDYENYRDDFNHLKDTLKYDGNSGDCIQQVANFIFLNKTCFNGLYRVNSNGHFNVPMGRYKKPLICDEDNIRNISEKLDNKNIVIENKSYKCSKDYITSDSFVYLDPPYRQINETSFTSYTKSNFSEEDQKELAAFCRDVWDKKGAKILLSNSGCTGNNEFNNFYKEEYINHGFNCKEIEAKRYINSNGKKRGPVKEILIKNY